MGWKPRAHTHSVLAVFSPWVVSLSTCIQTHTTTLLLWLLLPEIIGLRSQHRSGRTLFDAVILHMVLNTRTDKGSIQWEAVMEIECSCRIKVFRHYSSRPSPSFPCVGAERSLFNNDVTTVVIYWMRTGRGLLHLCVHVSLRVSQGSSFKVSTAGTPNNISVGVGREVRSWSPQKTHTHTHTPNLNAVGSFCWGGNPALFSLCCDSTDVIKGRNEAKGQSGSSHQTSQGNDVFGFRLTRLLCQTPPHLQSTL